MVGICYNGIMKTVDIIKWIATFFTIAGALATALMYDPLNVYLLNLGAVLFLVWGCMIKEKAMITVNASLLLIYVIGLVIRL
jgi:hypothetical protein